MKTETAKRMSAGLVVTVCAALLGSAGAQTLSTSDEILAFCEAKTKTITSWTANMKMTMRVAPQSPSTVTQEGTISAKKPNRIRVKLSMPMGGQAMDILTVHDGQFLWTEQSVDGQVLMVIKATQEDIEKAGGNVSGTTSLDWDELMKADKVKERYHVKSLSMQTVGGSPCYVLELRPKQAPEGKSAFTASSMRIYADAGTGLPMKIESFTSDGTLMGTMEYTNYKINPTLADHLFTYSPAPGVQVMDMSQVMRQMTPPGPGEAE